MTITTCTRCGAPKGFEPVSTTRFLMAEAVTCAEPIESVQGRRCRTTQRCFPHAPPWPCKRRARGQTRRAAPSRPRARWPRRRSGRSCWQRRRRQGSARADQRGGAGGAWSQRRGAATPVSGAGPYLRRNEGAGARARQVDSDDAAVLRHGDRGGDEDVRSVRGSGGGTSGGCRADR